MRLILFLLVSANCCISAAQPFGFTNYTTKEGLSSNYIAAVAQDKNGFLWIGTRNGLNRFDGNAFDPFYNNPQQPRSLASNEIQALHIDRQQRLWIGSVGGLSLYHPWQQQFSNYYPDSSLGKCGRWFCALQQAADGKIWVGTWYELLIFDPATEKFSRSGWANFAATHQPADGNHARVVILSLYPKGPQEMWVLTSYGLYSVNTTTRQFQWHPFGGVTDYFGCQINRTDAQGRLWIGTYNSGILCYDSRAQQWQQYLPPKGFNSVAGYNRSYGISEFNGDTLLFAALDGLALFDAKQGRFLQHLPQAEMVVNNIYRDGNSYWLHSSDGLRQMKAVKNWMVAEVPFEGRSFINKIYPLQHRPGHLVLGASLQSQLGIWQTAPQTFTPFRLANGKPIEGELTGWLQLNDSLAYLTTEEGFFAIDPIILKATPLPLPTKAFATNFYTARNMVTDGHHVWIRLRGQGIAQYNPKTGQSMMLSFITPSQEKAYSALYYNAAQQCLWVAVEHEGVYQYWPATGKLRHHLRFLPNGPVADITCITGDAAGNTYLTDVARGMYYYNGSNAQVTLYTRQNGLPSNNCYFVALDKVGAPWVVTVEGIVRMDMKTGTAINYSSGQNLPEGLSFLSADAEGNMYTCYNNYYYHWNINQLPQRNAQVPLYLRSIRINNQPVDIDSVYRLSHGQNNISLQVGAITDETVDFEYQLNNTGNWLPVEKGQMLNFSNLAPGNYRLQLRQKGTNNRLSLSINITPPWWLQPWFWLLALLLTALLVLFFVKRHVRQIRHRAEMKQQMAESEMMALRAQMNPHFIFNCISSIDNFIQDNDKENASAWLNKFARLIRGVLDNSQQAEIPFWKDWDTLRLYIELEQLRASHSFACELKADEALLNGHYRIPPLIVQPYVENAIQHGLRHRYDNEGLLRITAQLQGQQLLFTIEDNGIGRKKSSELNAFNNSGHNSYGMRLSKQRVQLFNAAPGHVTITDLYDAAGNAMGTKVEIGLAV